MEYLRGSKSEYYPGVASEVSLSSNQSKRDPPVIVANHENEKACTSYIWSSTVVRQGCGMDKIPRNVPQLSWLAFLANTSLDLYWCACQYSWEGKGGETDVVRMQLEKNTSAALRAELSAYVLVLRTSPAYQRHTV